MISARVAGVAGAVAAVLYLMLDSGVMREPVPKVMSVTLIVLALVFALGTWTSQFGGVSQRGPLFAGLSLGLGVYAILRLVIF